MRTITAGEFNTSFPEILKVISFGERVEILQDDINVPVAMIVPYLSRMEENRRKDIKSMKGFLKEFSNQDLILKEKEAWQSHIKEIYATF